MTSLPQFSFLRDLVKLMLTEKSASDRDVVPVLFSTSRESPSPSIPDLREMVLRGQAGPLFVPKEVARVSKVLNCVQKPYRPAS